MTDPTHPSVAVGAEIVVSHSAVTTGKVARSGTGAVISFTTMS